MGWVVTGKEELKPYDIDYRNDGCFGLSYLLASVMLHHDNTSIYKGEDARMVSPVMNGSSELMRSDS